MCIRARNGFDTHDGVEDIRAGIAFKGGETIHVEAVVLRGLVGKIAVFDG